MNWRFILSWVVFVLVEVLFFETELSFLFICFFYNLLLVFRPCFLFRHFWTYYGFGFLFALGCWIVFFLIEFNVSFNPKRNASIIFSIRFRFFGFVCLVLMWFLLQYCFIFWIRVFVVWRQGFWTSTVSILFGTWSGDKIYAFDP